MNSTLSWASRDISTTADIQMQAKDIFPNGELAVNQAKSYAKFTYDEPTIKQAKMNLILSLLWLDR